MTATVTTIHPERQAAAGIGSLDACGKAGISYRQLDHWTRCGLIHPIGEALPGTGYERRYSDAEVEVARVAKQLIDAGWRPDAALRLARQALDQPTEPLRLAGGLITITTGPAQ